MFPTPRPGPDQVSYERLQEKVGFLETQVHSLNEKLVTQHLEIEALNKRLPDTWLLDKNYWKRAVTVFAYYTVISLAIAVPIYCVVIAASLLIAGSQ